MFQIDMEMFPYLERSILLVLKTDSDPNANLQNMESIPSYATMATTIKLNPLTPTIRLFPRFLRMRYERTHYYAHPMRLRIEAIFLI